MNRDRLGIVPDVAVEVVSESLNEEGVTDVELGGAGAAILAAALHGEDHQVTALGHHPGEHGGADHLRPRRNDHLGDAAYATEDLLASPNSKGAW